MLYPYMTACRLYSRHRGFLRFCLSEHGICHISHNYADISIRSEHNPNVPLVSMNQYSGRSLLSISESYLFLRNPKQFYLENESGTSWYAWLRKLAITHFGWDIYLPFVAYTHLLHSDDPSFNEVAETDSQGCTSTAAVILLAIDGSSCVMCSDDASGRREPSLPPPAPLL